MVYTYVIRSKKDNKWYTGTTTDLRKRLTEHNSNKVTSTKNRGPFELIYYEGCLDMQDAFARERYLKTGPVRDKTPKVSVPISANISNGAGMGKRYLKNRMRRFLSLTGQVILEYGLIISIIVAAILAMQTYIKRGIQAQLKVSCDQMGRQEEGVVKEFLPEKQAFVLYSEIESETNSEPYTQRFTSQPGMSQTTESNIVTTSKTPADRPVIYHTGTLED